MALFKISTYAVIAFIVHLHQSQAAYMIRKVDHHMKNNRCFTYVTISGHGLDETFTAVCQPDTPMTVLFRSDGLLVGDYRKDNMCIFKDSPNSLVAIIGPAKSTKECQRRTTGGNREKTLTPDECEDVKIRVAFFKWDADERGTSDEGVNIIKTETLRDKTCTGSISILGNGIKYETEKIDCTLLRKIDVIFVPNGVVVDGYHQIGEALHTESANTLIRVRQDSCEKITFSSTNKGKQPEQSTSLLESAACFEAKKAVDSYIATSKITIYRYSYFKNDQCMQDLTVYGRGILDTFFMSCDDAEKLQVNYRRSSGTLVLGSHRRDSISAYTATSGELLVLKDSGKECAKHIYPGGTKREQALSAEECANVKKSVEKALKMESPNEAEKFTITKMRRSVVEGECKHVITFQGSAVDDIATVSCETAERMVLRFVPNGFILCDYEKNQLCFMKDSSKSLIQVLTNSSCKLLTYEGGEIKTKDTTQEQCDSARNKIQKYREKNLIE